MKAPTIIVAGALLLTGCATATPYQPLLNGVGYADQKLESNRYRISFSGNSMTPRETVENYVLYRAAEVTLANGYDYFTLASQATNADISGNATPYGFGFGGFGFGPHAGLGIGIGSGTDIRTEYQGAADIAMFRGKKPESDPHAYDARELKQNLEPAVVRPKSES